MTTDETSLGATVRAWRDRLTPAAVGLPTGRVRRAAGLRREELADLAGVSVDYIVRLEQGRATTPSPQVAGALARALHLSLDERDHLYPARRPPATERRADQRPHPAGHAARPHPARRRAGRRIRRGLADRVVEP